MNLIGQLWSLVGSLVLLLGVYLVAQNLPKFQQQTGVSHRVPWSQGILKVLKVFF